MEGFDTVLPADSVEFCPHPTAQDIFVCGTYQLEQSDAAGPSSGEDDLDASRLQATPQKRRGECLLFQVDPDDEMKISLKQKIPFPAILDMKWCYMDATARPTLGIADSEGKITLLELCTDKTRLRTVRTIQCTAPDTLCLSLDWSNRRIPSSTLGSLVVSLSNGSLTILRPDNESGLRESDSWHAHDFEPWIAAWDYWDTNIVYSGGDDLKLKGWDVRQGFSQSTFANKRFEGGVTTIQSHPHVEHRLAVGSYDKILRIFDTRNMRSPLSELDVGGGLWRVKWHPSPDRPNEVLVACMHDGFKVIRCGLEDSHDPTVVKRFDAHQSLAYGADWSFAPEKKGDGTLVATCSFYDHTLCLWRA